MADLHTLIRDQPEDVLELIAKSMDVRANEPAMRAICARYMGAIPRVNDLRVLEIGCGNGAATAHVLEYVEPRELVGVDPSEAFIRMARERYADRSGIRFDVGDAVDTGEPDASFDLAIAHTVFSHLPDPAAALQEAYRVLKPGGRLVVFDGDYATNTVALFAGDPLQTAMEVALRNLVHDPYVMRRLMVLARDVGFEVEPLDAHGYVQTTSPDYLLTLLARGVGAGANAGEMGQDLVEGFVSEALARVEAGTFYGAILFLSLGALKPA